MDKKGRTVELTTLEAKAVKAWLLDVSFGEPAKALVDMDWSDEEIDAVMASLAKKFNLRWGS
jgi:hypothetical protein